MSNLACVDGDNAGVDSTTDIATRTATLNLDPFESIVCTFTNSKVGSITIDKISLPTDGTDFSFSGDLGNFTLDDAIPNDVDNFGHALTFVDVFVGQIQVSELVPAGWVLNHIICTTQDPSDTTVTNLPGVLIDLDPDEHIVCFFVNVKSQGDNASITIPKVAFPADGTDFGFTGDLGSFT